MTVSHKETIGFLESNKQLWADRTPCFVVDKKSFLENLSNLKTELKGQIVYSHKTNPDKQIVELVINEGHSFLFSSIEELEDISKLKGFKAKECIFQSPSLTRDQLVEIKKTGVRRIIIDSEAQLKLILDTIDLENDKFELFIRINTGIKVNNPELPYGMDSFLGFPMPEAKEIIKRLDVYRKKGFIKLGVHNHLISQNTYLDIWKKNLKAISNFITELKDLDITIDYVDFGGGYPVTYTTSAPNIHSIGTLIADVQKQITQIYPKIKYIFEPGRKVVAESICLIGKVSQLKKFNGTNVAILNCSLYNSSMDTLIVGLCLKTDRIGNKSSKINKNYIIRGCTPDSLDVFARDKSLPALSDGDYLIFHTAGAYSFHSDFISLKKPEYILI